MTTLKDFLQEKSNTTWTCQIVKPLIDRSVEDMYNGVNGPTDTKNPSGWLLVLAHTNLDAAKTVVIQAIKNVANTLEAGDLKTKIESLSVEMTESQLDALITWSDRLRRSENKTILHSALHAVAKLLKTSIPGHVLRIGDCLVQHDVETNKVSLAKAKDTLHAFLRSQVDLATWKGPYT